MSKDSLFYRTDYSRHFPDKVPRRAIFNCEYTIVTTRNVSQVIRDLSLNKEVSLDTETTGLDLFNDRVVTIQFSTAQFNYVLVNPFEKDSIPQLASSEIDVDIEVPEMHQVIDTVLNCEKVYMWNMWFDVPIMINNLGGNIYKFKNVIDAMHLTFLLDANIDRRFDSLSLKVIALRLLGIEYASPEAMFSPEGILGVNLAEAFEYGAKDAFCTRQIGMKVCRAVLKEMPLMLDLHKKYNVAHYHLIMERRPINIKYARECIDDINTRVSQIKAEVYAKYGFINLASPRDKSNLLFRQGLFTGKECKETKDGQRVQSVKADLLDDLYKKTSDPLVKHMKDYASLIKQRDSYFQKFVQMAEMHPQGVRCWYLDSHVATMRLASGTRTLHNKKDDMNFANLNLQNLTKVKSVYTYAKFDKNTCSLLFSEEYKEGYSKIETQGPKLNVRSCLCVPDDDWLIVEADFFAEELVLQALFSGEPAWIEAFARGDDVHAATGKKIFAKENITDDERKIGKVCNLFLTYDGTVETILEKVPGSTRPIAEKWWSDFHNGLPVLFAWKAAFTQKCMLSGVIPHILGFKRYMSQYKTIKGGYAHFKRSCLNSPIQGAGGIICRIVLSNMDRKIYTVYSDEAIVKAQFEGDARIFLTTHDSFAYLVKKTRVKEFCHVIEDVMRKATPPSLLEKYGFGLSADIKIGNDYGRLVGINTSTWELKSVVEAKPSEDEDDQTAVDNVVNIEEYAGVEY